MVHGPDAALAAIEKLAADPRRRDYCYLLAVRAHILEQVSRTRPRNTRERQRLHDDAVAGPGA
jgi:predicted RNA polymerase sigma factor